MGTIKPKSWRRRCEAQPAEPRVKTANGPTRRIVASRGMRTRQKASLESESRANEPIYEVQAHRPHYEASAHGLNLASRRIGAYPFQKA